MGRAGVELTTGRRWTALILLVMRRSPVRFREAAPRPEAHSDHGRGLCASEGANSRRLVTLSPGDYALSRPGRRCRRRPRRCEGASQGACGRIPQSRCILRVCFSMPGGRSPSPVGSFSPWSAWPRLGRSGAGAAELRCQLQLDSWLTTCPARSSYAWYVAAIVYAMRSLKAAKAM